MLAMTVAGEDGGGRRVGPAPSGLTGPVLPKAGRPWGNSAGAMGTGMGTGLRGLTLGLLRGGAGHRRVKAVTIVTAFDLVSTWASRSRSTRRLVVLSSPPAGGGAGGGRVTPAC